MTHRYLRVLAIALAWVALLPAAAFAQASITGVVRDSPGAVLPGVTVTLSGQALIQPQTAVTTESGAYRFPRIPNGAYALAFDLSGFKTIIREGNIPQAGVNADIDPQMDHDTVQATQTRNRVL